MHSATVKDYLKAIYLLQTRNGVARTGALARQLGITAGSVTGMVKRMARMSPALLTYRQHQGVKLTGHGQKAALAAIRRHRLLETFLHQTLGLGWEAVHEEAVTLEHHLSDRLVAAIDRHLAHPAFDPHGEPIPDAHGRMVNTTGQPLPSIRVGSTFRVERVDPCMEKMLSYLDDLGIGLETTGTLVAMAPFDGPLTLQLRVDENGREVNIARRVAEQIYVAIQ